jgi:nucleotide-binding universal stress UspA family protein
MTIAVATDFSPCSQAATRLAGALARRQKATLLLVHVIEPFPGDTVIAPMGGAWEAEFAASAENLLRATAQELRDTGLTVEVQVRFGTAAQGILDAAAAAKADLIAVGTHGRRGAARLFVGSCAEEVVRKSPCPVLVTGADASGVLARLNQGAPLRLTVVTDGSQGSEAAFSWVRTSEVTPAANVSLVRVYWPPQEAARYGLDDSWHDRDGRPELQRLLERDLRRDAQALMGLGDPAMRFTPAGHDAGEAIRHDVRQLGADAVVIAVPAHRRATLTGLKVSSVLRATGVPVFCVPGRAHPIERHIAQVRSVLMPCDLSERSRAGLLAAYGLLAGGGRAELVFVHERELSSAAASGLPPRPALTDDERAAIEARLRAAVPAEAAEHGIATHVSVIEGDEAAEAILQAADRLDVDVIALASHGRSGLKRAVLGSVAEAVTRRAARPVFIIRRPADQAS